MDVINDKERGMLYVIIERDNQVMQYQNKFKIGSKTYRVGTIKYLPDGTRIQEIEVER